jgi:hypothetical protein
MRAAVPLAATAAFSVFLRLQVGNFTLFGLFHRLGLLALVWLLTAKEAALLPARLSFAF